MTLALTFAYFYVQWKEVSEFRGMLLDKRQGYLNMNRNLKGHQAGLMTDIERDDLDVQSHKFFHITQDSIQELESSIRKATPPATTTTTAAAAAAAATSF